MVDLIPRLRHELDLLLVTLDGHAAFAEIFDGTADRPVYAELLVQTHHYVRWTRPLLVLAAARLRRLGGRPHLADLFRRKAAEESGHDRWVRADLEALGLDVSRTLAGPPCAAASAYIAWNRFAVESGHPTAYLGTAYVLEGLAARRAGSASENLVRRGRIPGIDRAVTFLRGHGAADGPHLEQLEAILAEVHDSAEQDAIALSARVTATLYPGLLDRSIRAVELVAA